MLNKLSYIFIIVLINIVPLTKANAQFCEPSSFYDDGDCPEGENCWLNDGVFASTIYYYIETSMASDFRSCTPSNDDDTLSDSQLRRTIHSAANIWNNQGNGRVLIYGGVTTPGSACNNITNKPAVFISWEDCREDQNNIGHCVTNSAANASEFTNCSGVVKLTIYGSKDDNIGINNSSTTNCVNNPYRVDWKLGSLVEEETSETNGYKKNLISTLVHEFGHVLGLGHSEEVAVIDSIMYDDLNNSTRKIIGDKRPHLWQWDRNCSDNNNGGRLLEYSYVEKADGGSWSNKKEITSLFTSKGFISGGYIRSVSTSYYTSYHDIDFKYGSIGSDGILNFSNTGVIPVNARNSYFQPTFLTPIESSYSDDKARMSYHTNSNDPPQIKYYKSSNLFSSSTDKDWIICLNAACTINENLASHIPLATTYDPVSNKTIYARVITERPLYDSDSGRIVVHPGEYSESHLRLGTLLPNGNLPPTNDNWNYNAKTDFVPGIACADSDVESFNCVLFWNDNGSIKGRFLYKYFKIITIFSIPTISWDTDTHEYTSYNIVNGISAGFAENKLYITFIHDSSSYPYRNVKILSNSLSNQTSWSLSKDVSASDIADPPTVLYKNGNEFGVIWTEVETGL